MRYRSPAEKLLIQEITQAAERLEVAVRGLKIGQLIKAIRLQLGMSQKALAKYAGLPQSTISRIEQGERDASLSTITKILKALSCDVVIAPVLNESIDAIRRKQARKIAKKRVNYLKGTMNLEEQQPDESFIEALLQEEENRLLQGQAHKLWEAQ
jgi:transcriptional regulator with XRE-family HTH domain